MKIRPIKRVWCWIVGHNHRTAGDYSMCWRCGQIIHKPNNPIQLKKKRKMNEHLHVMER